MSVKKERVEEFMRAYAVVMGVIMGLGFIFLGIIRKKSLVVILGFVGLLMGLLTISTLLKEEDEYEICNITPKAPKKSARTST